MDKSPASPTFVEKRVHHKIHQSSKNLYHRIKSQVKNAIDASRQQNTRSLYYDYMQIGIALGIDKICTDFIQGYAKFMSQLVTPRESRSFSNEKFIFNKDPENLLGMMVDENWDHKVAHIQQFLKRRKIPNFIIETLHVPRRKYKDETLIDETNTFKKLAVGEEKIRSNVVCQTVIERPTYEKNNNILLGIEMKVKKEVIEDYQAENQNLNSLPIRETKSDDAKDTTVQFTEWYRPKLVTLDDNRMPGSGPMRVGEESNSKRAAPYKINSIKKNSVHCRNFNTEIIRLVIKDLSPEMDAIDIEEWFRDAELLECCRLKYDRDTGKSLGKATVAFTNRDAAMKALNYFRAENDLGVQILLPGDQTFD